MPIAPGENVGPYRVIEQLGSGGMATVYKAYHPALDRYVALKVLHAAIKADPQFFERFQREARIVAKLEHPHIIPVYDFNEHHGEPYLVMRFVTGDTLKPQMGHKPLPSQEILRLMRPVCQALDYAHQQGVLHRDIKPSNILVTNDGNVFLTDFGLARMMQMGESTLSQDRLMGTPQYISPEQAQGSPTLDGRTDIYSLGVVLYEMFTGQVPFNADTPFATIHDHIYKPLPMPTKLNPEIDPAVERLLLKTLAKDPNDRYITAAALLQALENILEPQLATTSPAVKSAPKAAASPALQKGWPWWVWAGAAVLVLIMVGAIGLGLWRRTRLTPPSNLAVPTQAANLQPAAPPTPPPGQPTPASAQAQLPAGPAEERAAQLTYQATAAMGQQQLDQAVKLYQQATAADPHFLPAYFGLSLALQKKGDQAGSIRVLEEAVAQNPTNPEAHMRLGEIYLNTNNPTAALSAFEQATALDPTSAGAYARQGFALMALQRKEEAKVAIETALRLDRLNPEARLANAFYLMKEGQRRQARQELLQLVQDRRSPQFVIERARLLLEEIKN
jgi:serine/threonine-protein kinase